MKSPPSSPSPTRRSHGKKREATDDDTEERAIVGVATTPPKGKPKRNNEQPSPSSIVDQPTASTNPVITDPTNRATLAVTRYLPSALNLDDTNKIFIVILGKFYALSHVFKQLLDVAVDWYSKADSPLSSMDAKAVHITVCDCLDEAMSAVKDAGATQHVPIEEAFQISPLTVSAAVARAIHGEATASDIITIENANLSTVTQSSSTVLTPPKNIGDLHRSAINANLKTDVTVTPPRYVLVHL